jgi:hypothetical protein
MRDIWANWVYSGYNKSAILTVRTVKRFPIHALLLLFASQKNYVIKRTVPKVVLKRKISIRAVLDSRELVYTAFYKR